MRPKSCCGRAATADAAAPSRRTASSNVSTVTLVMRWPRRSAQADNRPLPETGAMPAMRSDDHADRSARFNAAHARPSPRRRSKSSTPSSGDAPGRIHARVATRTRSPSTRRRRSTRGSVVSMPIDGAITDSLPPTTCSSPRPSSDDSGSAPARCCPGSPRTCQRPSSLRSRVRSTPRRRSSVNERPGSRPAYCDTRISASPIGTASLPSPMRRPSTRSSGPRRVHSVST